MPDAGSLYREAQAAWSQGRAADAQRLFQAAIDADPSLPHAYFGLATALDRSGVAVNRSRAAQAYETFIQRAGSDPALGPQVAQARQRLEALRPPPPQPAPAPAPPVHPAARPQAAPRPQPGPVPARPARPQLPRVRFSRTRRGGGVFKLFVDGEPVGQLRKDESTVIQVAPGKRLLEVRAGMTRRKLSVALAAGDEAYVDLYVKGGLQISLRELRKAGRPIAEPQPAPKSGALRGFFVFLAWMVIIGAVLIVIALSAG